MSNPRTQAIAYRLWAYASPRGWDCTASEAADAIGVSLGQVAVAIRIKGWSDRFRTLRTDSINAVHQSGMMQGFDELGAL